MTRNPLRLPICRLCLSFTLLLPATPSVAQDNPATAPGSKQDSSLENRALIRTLLERVETLEVELKKLRESGKTVVPSDPSKQQVVAMVESAFLGAPYYRTTGNRFFAAKLVLV
ncbi:MAG: hypothetical protein VB861_16655, partial [Planctomycetaceae bacterium]